MFQILEYRAKEQSIPLRNAYWAFMRENNFSARQLVFLDETHCKPNDLRRKYGLSMRGVPAFMYVNRSAHGIGNGCSGICAMSLRGMISVTIQQRMINQEVFMNTLVNEVLPQMNPYPMPESVLIMDNAATHNHEEVVECCRLVGVKAVFLPPYSYDFNPIEFAYHQFKQYIRDKWQMHL
jgi:hypothetical protein